MHYHEQFLLQKYPDLILRTLHVNVCVSMCASVCVHMCTMCSIIIFILPLKELKIWEIMWYSTILLLVWKIQDWSLIFI